MKMLWRNEKGIGMVMVIAFMGLAVPLVTAGLALAGGLSIDSQVKSRKAQDQYATLGVLEYTHYLLGDPERWEGWWQAHNGQGSLALNGQEITFTISAPEEVSIVIDSIWQDEPVGSLADGSGTGTDTAQVRSERSGSGNGRVYHIGFTATPTSDRVVVCSDAFHNASGCQDVPIPDVGSLECPGAVPSVETIWSPNGGLVPVNVLGVSSSFPCSGEVLIGVSHDGSSLPVDGGALYDSTQAQ